MAKTPQKPQRGSSKIRFIMLEADLAEGDLNQVTQAIQNALRPTAGPLRIAAPQRNGAGSAAATQADEVTPEAALEETVVDREQAEEEQVQGSQPSKPRKYRSPKVLNLDLSSGLPFAQFAGEKNPSSDQMRYLTVAAWFKLHRNTDAITADHVYTCFRHVKWSADIDDFGAPLRQLKARDFMEGAGRGEYAINHIGIQEVENLGKS